MGICLFSFSTRDVRFDPSYRGPQKVADFLGRGGAYGVIVSTLLAKCFNHRMCDDESPVSRTKITDIHLDTGYFLLFFIKSVT